MINFKAIMSNASKMLTGKHTKGYILEVSNTLCMEVLSQMKIKDKDKYGKAFLESVSFIPDLYDNDEEFYLHFREVGYQGHALYSLTAHGKQRIIDSLNEKLNLEGSSLLDPSNTNAMSESEKVVSALSELLNFLCTTKQEHPDALKNTVLASQMLEDLNELMLKIASDSILRAHSLKRSNTGGGSDLIQMEEYQEYLNPSYISVVGEAVGLIIGSMDSLLSGLDSKKRVKTLEKIIYQVERELGLVIKDNILLGEKDVVLFKINKTTFEIDSEVFADIYRDSF